MNKKEQQEKIKEFALKFREDLAKLVRAYIADCCSIQHDQMILDQLDFIVAAMIERMAMVAFASKAKKDLLMKAVEEYINIIYNNNTPMDLKPTIVN